MAHQVSKTLLTDLLQEVSRSFYLTLRVLPKRIRPQIGLAYLLARTSDTIADTEVLPKEERLRALEAFRERCLGHSSRPLAVQQFIDAQKVTAEKTLLVCFEESCKLLEHLDAADQRLIRGVLDTITSGQELDLRRFATASRENIVALETGKDLDDYTYRVAGCVGEFWTRMCLAHLYPRARLQQQVLVQNGIRFGKGLQLVNILRDLPFDLQQGRCYMPASALSMARLAPGDLVLPKSEEQFRPVFQSHLRTAEEHLWAGWAYTTALPRRSVRVRLACAWPILIGLETIKLLRASSGLDPARKVKVSRKSLNRILVRSVLLYPLSAAWDRQVRPGALPPGPAQPL